MLLFGEILFAQYTKEYENSRNLKIGLVPHYLIFRGIRFDFEKKMIEGKSIIFAPQIYYRNRKVEDIAKIENENYFKTLYGAGVDVYQKHYFKATNITYCYYAYGLSYNYFDLTFNEYSWKTYTENGIEFQKWEISNINEQIHRGGINFIIGIDNDIYDIFYFDVYIGLGLKYSYPITNTKQVSSKFDAFMTNYAYSGTVFTSGIKIGFKR